MSEKMIHFSALLKQHHFNGECSIEIQMLKFVNENRLMSAFPNVSFVLRMYLYMMFSNCFGERSFSMLKIVNNQLRSSLAGRG